MKKMYGAIKFPAEIHFERLEFVWSSVERLSKAKVSENVVNWNTWNWLRIKVVVSFILLNIELSGIVEFNWFWSGAVFHCSSMSIIIILFTFSQSFSIVSMNGQNERFTNRNMNVWEFPCVLQKRRTTIRNGSTFDSNHSEEVFDKHQELHIQMVDTVNAEKFTMCRHK